MKYYTILIFQFFLLQTVYGQLWLVDPLEAIYPDHNHLKHFNNIWEADFPLGTDADVHVLVKIPKESTFKIITSKNGTPLNIEVWSQLIDVPVEQNTGLDSRTEQFMNKKNPHVVRRAPFRIFEVLQPLKDNAIVSKTKFSAFRLAIPPELINQPGQHKIKIEIRSDGFKADGIFKINVHPVKLPELAQSNFFYTNWFSLTNIEKYHGLERWSKPWFKMMNKYARLMAHGRQNSVTIPGELIRFENDSVILDQEKMLAFIDIFRKYGFKYYEAPHLMFRGENDDWGDPELKVTLTGRRYYKENGKDDIAKLMQSIKQFCVKNNLTENWLQHISDEPTSVNSACYKDIVKQVKEIFPQVKIMEATNDKEGILGAIDIWCPLINDFQENELFFRERQNKGEKVLVYTCLIPGGKWLNRTLDMEKIRQVYFGWGASYYNTGGYLHWGLNQYKEDPFENSVVKHPSPAASANNYLPAGDTHIVYPGSDGPLSSIRFEAHRIGCEDYELLQTLGLNKKQKQQRLIKNLFRSYTDYNLNLTTYRSTRKKLLKSLSKIGSK
ncbi:DUF4091 domain-containing protein [Maribacter sp. HTCC2170]|uniref:DUF4091 domain-containing protein n=1 Tax=Maribacter sp. (strain HTCC2170 / KCCM 42371) TaxID=313603 RepID=UPI00006B2182|nr:DUF4091 domain-containing protein [Maribacter sp. HTCC2170]EAR00151.1 hypothetical protein FB2170_00755 [Maribacter sp. HTCC2170]